MITLKTHIPVVEFLKSFAFCFRLCLEIMPPGFAAVDICEGFTSALKGSTAVPEQNICLTLQLLFLQTVPTFPVLLFMGKKLIFDFSESESMLTINKSK